MNRRNERLLLILVYAAVAALIGWLTVVAAYGQEWQFSPPAVHHRSIVRVQSGSQAGSGVYIAQDGFCGVLTAAHVIQPNQTATVFWSDGTQSQGVTRADKHGHDIGMVLTSHPSIAPLEVAVTDPTPGSRVEFVTYGGPENRLRSFWSAFEGERQLVNGSDALYTVAVSSGDSGGAILDSSHRVVGIVSGGRTASVNGDGWPVHRGSVSAPRGPIRAFVQRVLCPPGNPCPPRGDGRGIQWERGGQIEFPRGRGVEWERGGRIEFYPPRQQQTPPPVLPGPGPVEPDEPLEPIKPPGVSQESIDAINARLDALAAAIAAIPAGRTGDTGQQGERGLQGLPGKDGAPGVFDPATLTDDQAAALAKRLPAMIFQAKTPDGKMYGDPVPKRLGETVFLKTPKGD